jgi:Rieske 2Fe-2S family protein
MTHRLVPVAPARTVVECEWLFPPEAVERPGFDPAYAVDFWDRTNGQDWRACESVQGGLASVHHRPGPLAPHEDAVHRFVALVAERYLDATPAPSADPSPA